MRAPPHERGPAPVAAGSEAEKTLFQGEQQRDSKAAQSAQALAKRTHALAVIADWRDELHARIDLAQLRLELVGLDHEEQDLLADEVQNFKRLVIALTATMPTTSRRAA